MGVMGAIRKAFGLEGGPVEQPRPSTPAWATPIARDSKSQAIDMLRAKGESDIRMVAAEDFYRTYGEAVWVYRCITAIAQSIAEVPFRFYRERFSLVGGRRFEPFETEAARMLLRRPNPRATWFDLVEETLVHLELTGDAYLEKVPRIGKVELYALPPHQMKILPDPKRLVAGYEQWVGSRLAAHFEPDEISHVKYFSPLSDLHGMPPVLAAAKAVIVDLLSHVYNKRFFENNANPDLVIEYERTLGQEYADRLSSQWRALHGGVDRAHGIAVVDGGGKTKPLGTTHKDMAFGELTRMSREEQLAAFGVPPVKVGLLEHASFDNAKSQREEFWRTTELPKMRKLEAAFDADVCPLLGEGIIGRFAVEEIRDLQENEKEKVDRIIQLVDRGILVGNEARERLMIAGKKPWGDVWWAPLGLAPVSSEASPAAPMVPAENVTSPEASDEEPAVAELEEPITAANSLHGDYARVLDREFGKRVKFSEVAKTRMWKARDARARAAEKRMVAALKREFERQAKKVSGQVDEIYASHAAMKTAKTDTRVGLVRVLAAETFFDDKPLVELFKVFGLLAAQESGEATAGLLGRKEWVRRPEVLDEFLRTKVASAIKVNATTREAVRDVLADALEEVPRPSLADVTRRVRGVFETASLSRSATIAQTETIRSYGFGEVEAYKQAGVERKGWLSQRDGRTRPSHRNVESVAVDRPFTVGGAKLQFPGDPGGPATETINCRCGTIPEFE